MGLRPDRAVIVYGNLIRQTYKHTPIIIGGIEASLRRLAHYDYWSDSLKRSVLLDSGADLISYGMGERSILEIAEALNRGEDISTLHHIAGTVYHTKEAPAWVESSFLLMKKCDADKRKYAESFQVQYENMEAFSGKVLAESYGNRGYVVQNPPSKPLSQKERMRFTIYRI